MKLGLRYWLHHSVIDRRAQHDKVIQEDECQQEPHEIERPDAIDSITVREAHTLRVEPVVNERCGDASSRVNEKSPNHLPRQPYSLLTGTSVHVQTTKEEREGKETDADNDEEEVVDEIDDRVGVAQSAIAATANRHEQVDPEFGDAQWKDAQRREHECKLTEFDLPHGDGGIIDSQSTVVVGVTCGDSGTLLSGVTGDGDSSGILGPVVIACLSSLTWRLRSFTTTRSYSQFCYWCQRLQQRSTCWMLA